MLPCGASLIRLVDDLLDHEADARKIADGDGCAHEAAEDDRIVELHPAHQMQRREKHPHDRGAECRAARDAEQLLFGFRL